MSALNKGGRTTTFMCTKGELRADMEKNTLEFYCFDTLETTEIYKSEEAVDQTIAGGHGGGDLGIMADLYEYVANNNPSNSISDIGISSMSYLMCFAAELSRETNTVVDMQDYMYNLQYK
jgi:hypothetical protein